MRCRHWAMGPTLALLFAWAGTAKADDVMRLGHQGDAAITTLDLHGSAETVPVHWHRWGHDRCWYGWRRAPRFYGGFYAGPACYAAPGYGPTPVYRIYGGRGAFWANFGLSIASGVLNRVRQRVLLRPREIVLPPAKGPADATYPYDGGPDNPVPLPKTEPLPAKKPAAPPVADGHVVSLPQARPAKYRYRAFGEPVEPPSGSKEPIVVVRDSTGHKR